MSDLQPIVATCLPVNRPGRTRPRPTKRATWRRSGGLRAAAATDAAVVRAQQVSMARDDLASYQDYAQMNSAPIRIDLLL